MGHAHHHHHAHSEKNIKIAFFLNLVFSVIEIVGGLLTNSIAILSDALHDLGDSFTLGISWYFARIAKKQRTKSYSYGFQRYSVLGAIVSAIVLISGSIFIVIEAVPRLINPVNPDTQGMILLAIGGLAVNSIAAYRLSKGKTINEKVVFTHLVEDVLGWAATLVGAIVMHFTFFPILDPILSLLISLYILFNVIKNLRESFRIILQGTPSNINIEKIHSEVLNIPSVNKVLDCHAWTMDGDFNVLSMHLLVDKQLSLTELEKIKSEAKARLEDQEIHHATIEFEIEEKDYACE